MPHCTGVMIRRRRCHFGGRGLSGSWMTASALQAGRGGASTIAAAASVAISIEAMSARAVAVGVQPAGQDDDERFGLRVDPETGAGEAGMAEARATEERAPRRAVTGLHVPAQPPPLARRCRRRRRSWPAPPAAKERGGRWGPTPPFNSVWAKIARSSAVANNPAWPATPPNARDRGS